MKITNIVGSSLALVSVFILLVFVSLGLGRVCVCVCTASRVISKTVVKLENMQKVTVRSLPLHSRRKNQKTVHFTLHTYNKALALLPEKDLALRSSP